MEESWNQRIHFFIEYLPHRMIFLAKKRVQLIALVPATLRKYNNHKQSNQDILQQEVTEEDKKQKYLVSGSLRWTVTSSWEIRPWSTTEMHESGTLELLAEISWARKGRTLATTLTLEIVAGARGSKFSEAIEIEEIESIN